MTTLATEARELRQNALALRLEAQRLRGVLARTRDQLHAQRTTNLVLSDVAKNGRQSLFWLP